MKLLFFPSNIGEAHIYRSTIVAKTLQRKGYTIAFGFPYLHSLIKNNNFQFHKVEDLANPREKFIENPNVFSAYTVENVEYIVMDEIRAIQNFKPDLILSDFKATVAISKRAFGIPFVSIVNAYMTDYFDPAKVIMNDKANRFKQRVSSFIGKKIQKKQKRELSQALRMVAWKYKIKDLSNLYDFYKGDLTLIADLPEYCPLENLPDGFQYIGPILNNVKEQKAKQYFPKNAPKKIYVTIGNTGNPLLIKKVIEAFRDKSDYEIVATTGAYFQHLNGAKYDNITISDFILPDRVLKKADLVIHCGGNGTTYQSLKYGKPSIVVPCNNDQMINTYLIRNHKIGIVFNLSDITTEILHTAVDQLLANQNIKENVRFFQKKLTHISGSINAANKIEEVLKLSSYDSLAQE